MVDDNSQFTAYLKLKAIKHNVILENDDYENDIDDDYSVSDTDILRKKENNPSAAIRSQTYDLLITSLNALPLSYRRLVGAKAIKLDCFDDHPATAMI